MKVATPEDAQEWVASLTKVKEGESRIIKDVPPRSKEMTCCSFCFDPKMPVR